HDSKSSHVPCASRRETTLPSCTQTEREFLRPSDRDNSLLSRGGDTHPFLRVSCHKRMPCLSARDPPRIRKIGRNNRTHTSVRPRYGYRPSYRPTNGHQS